MAHIVMALYGYGSKVDRPLVLLRAGLRVGGRLRDGALDLGLQLVARVSRWQIGEELGHRQPRRALAYIVMAYIVMACTGMAYY